MRTLAGGAAAGEGAEERAAAGGAAGAGVSFQFEVGSSYWCILIEYWYKFNLGRIRT